MKTTIGRPPDLVREMKLIALNEGKKLKVVASELLKRGIEAGERKPARASKDFLLTASPKTTYKDTTDAHLIRLAAQNDLKLATLDHALMKKSWAQGHVLYPMT